RADLAPVRGCRGRRLRYADTRLARQIREYASAVAFTRARPIASRCLQRRRLRRGSDGTGSRRVDLQGALSERLDPGWPGASVAAGVFLRLGVAARPDPPSPQTARRYHKARR